MIECTTSASNTVTCLYSADVAAGVIGAPHLLQNRESGGSSVPHDVHDSVLAISPPPPSPPGSRQYRVTAGQRCPAYRRAAFPPGKDLEAGCDAREGRLHQMAYSKNPDDDNSPLVDVHGRHPGEHHPRCRHKCCAPEAG